MQTTDMQTCRNADIMCVLTMQTCRRADMQTTDMQTCRHADAMGVRTQWMCCPALHAFPKELCMAVGKEYSNWVAN